MTFWAIVFWVIFSIVMHELAHGWAALWQGDDTPRRMGHMTINPMVHMGPWSLLMFAMSGFECGTAAGEEMRDAQRDVPRSIGASAIVSVGCYVLPILAILVVMPASKVSSVAGFMDAATRSFAWPTGSLKKTESARAMAKRASPAIEARCVRP